MKVCERDRVKMWEKQEKVKAYEGLQSLLLTELPLLNRNGQAMVITAFDSLAAACLYLQGRMARIYLLMAKVWLTANLLKKFIFYSLHYNEKLFEIT